MKKDINTVWWSETDREMDNAWGQTETWTEEGRKLVWNLNGEM